MLRGAGAVLIALAVAVPAAAEDHVDPMADRVLRDMGAYLAAAREFSFRVEEAFDRVLSTGENHEYGLEALVAVRRPDRLQVDASGDLREERLWYDGERFAIADLRQQAWSARAVPGPLDAALDHLAEEYGISSPVADFVYADPYAVLIARVQGGRYVGRHRVDGVYCHHLAFTQEAIDWQIWVEDGHRPVPRKIVITYKNVKSAPAFRAVLSEWDFEPRLADSLFRFEPPPGFVEADLFVPGP